MTPTTGLSQPRGRWTLRAVIAVVRRRDGGLWRWATALVIAHVVTLLACTNPVEPTAVGLDQEFRLTPGSAAVFEAENLQVGFDQVLSDSRCPIDAICIVAGEATVRIWLSKASRGRVDLELKTTPSASQAAYDAYRVRLVNVMPSRRASQTIAPTDYSATLLVTRSP
jgi:hypothetical protein